MATSIIKKPLESELGGNGDKTLRRIGTLGTGSSAAQQDFILPTVTARYLIFVYRTAADSNATCGMYMAVVYHSSNSNRMTLAPIHPVTTGSFSGEYDEADGLFKLHISGTMNFNAWIYQFSP